MRLTRLGALRAQGLALRRHARKRGQVWRRFHDRNGIGSEMGDLRKNERSFWWPSSVVCSEVTHKKCPNST